MHLDRRGRSPRGSQVGDRINYRAKGVGWAKRPSTPFSFHPQEACRSLPHRDGFPSKGADEQQDKERQVTDAQRVRNNQEDDPADIGLTVARRCSRERHSQTVTPMAAISNTSAAAATPASANITPMLTAITGSSSKPHPHPPGLYTADCRRRSIVTPSQAIVCRHRGP